MSRQILSLLRKLPGDVEFMVGIPRSGLLPGIMLALYLDLPLTGVDGLVEGRVLQAGRRYRGRDLSACLSKKRNVPANDDSGHTGTQMDQVRERLRAGKIAHNINYVAVYVAPGSTTKVDFLSEIPPMPRSFERNVMHHSMLRNCCVDFDGVICRGPSEGENDDVINYERFLRNVEPLLVPSVPIGWLVTFRLEKYRDITEEWLARHRIEYRALTKMDFPDKTTPMASKSHGKYKADTYKATGPELSIESSSDQAAEIAKLSGKDVLWMEKGEVVIPSIITESFQMARDVPWFSPQKMKGVFGSMRRSFHNQGRWLVGKISP